MYSRKRGHGWLMVDVDNDVFKKGIRYSVYESKEACPAAPFYIVQDDEKLWLRPESILIESGLSTIAESYEEPVVNRNISLDITRPGVGIFITVIKPLVVVKLEVNLYLLVDERGNQYLTIDISYDKPIEEKYYLGEVKTFPMRGRDFGFTPFFFSNGGTEWAYSEKMLDYQAIGSDLFLFKALFKEIGHARAYLKVDRR